MSMTFFDLVRVKGPFKTPGANQFCEVFNSTRIEVDYTLATSMSTGNWRALFRGGRVVGHVLPVGQAMTLRYYMLDGSGAWSPVGTDLSVAAGTIQPISWLYSDNSSDFAVVLVAGGTPPTSVQGEITIVSDRSSGT